MTEEEVTQATCGWLQTVTGLGSDHILVGAVGGLRPGEPYLAVTHTSTLESGTDEVITGEAVGDDAVEEVRAHRHAIFSVQAFGAGAGDLLNRAKIGYSQEIYKRAANSLLIQVLDVGAVIALPILEEPRWKDRRQADVTVGWVDVSRNVELPAVVLPDGTPVPPTGTIAEVDVDGDVGTLALDIAT